jgi:hypothetical protein
MKPLVLYHTRADEGCPDGFGAAFAAWLKLGDEAEYRAVQYGEMSLRPRQTFDPHKNYHSGHIFHPANLAGREIYILDFSFSRETTDHLFKHAARVVWLDHHDTAFKMWCGDVPRSGYWLRNPGEDSSPTLPVNAVVHLDNNKSGAMLAWEYFHSGKPVPMLIKHIDDYDRWQFKLDGTREFNAMLTSYEPWSFAHWTTFLAMHNHMAAAGASAFTCEYYDKAIAEGSAILRAHQQQVRKIVEGSARNILIRWFDGYVDGQPSVNAFSGLAANCPRTLVDDVGNELAKMSGTFGLTWRMSQEDMTAIISIRSIGDYDVEAIAKAFGGGGHKNAAGFEVPINQLLEWLR